jgi:HEPN domain-containing protein
MKQTAVEFLVDEFNEKLIGHNLPEWVEKIIQQAKEMEKEIIRTAYLDGMDGEYNTSEQYYNETFKSE